MSARPFHSSTIAVVTGALWLAALTVLGCAEVAVAQELISVPADFVRYLTAPAALDA